MRIILLILLGFCPFLLAGQKWKTYDAPTKIALAKIKAQEIYNQIEPKIQENRRPFIQRFAWLAVYDYNEYGVLASIKLAQGGLECGWGTILNRGLTGNNYFSIKCREKKHLDGNCFLLNDAGQLHHFVRYNNAFDSFRGHTFHLLRYYPQLFKKTSYKDWAYILGRKYAVDGDYASKLILIIKNLQLYRFDVKI